ncbi:MAG: hypothetical protein AAFX93_07445 [Verrucomicrobiota bacterium]
MEGNSTLIIAIVIGVVIALLAVALFVITRKSGKKKDDHAEPLVERNPSYGPRSDDDSEAEAAAAVEDKPAPSPLKPRAEKVAEAKEPEPKKVEAPKAEAPKEAPKAAAPPEPKKAEPKKLEPAAKAPVEEDDGWGDDDDWGIETSSDLDAIGEVSLEDDFSADVKKQQEDATPKKKLVERRSSEDDEDEWGDDIVEEDELDDGWTGPVLKRVSAEVKEAFKEASLSQEFHVSKRKEADEFIVKCVQSYLGGNKDEAVKAAQERVFALHTKIQLSDLPEIIESFVDSGEESNQAFFADFEDMCNNHDDSVLVLFEKFNTTLPNHLRSRRIAEVTEPLAAVVYLAPEWDESDFSRPDFDDRDEDIDEDMDYLEEFYDQLEDDPEDEEADNQTQQGKA